MERCEMRWHLSEDQTYWYYTDAPSDYRENGFKVFVKFQCGPITQAFGHTYFEVYEYSKFEQGRTYRGKTSSWFTAVSAVERRDFSALTIQ